ncbi:MAG TPA: hypothetical protein VGM94_13085 [Galbitalea sp.]|jgi:hypothetical protein
MTATATRKSLLVPMLDFPRDFEAETNLWFDTDHVPERLSCDGIEWCERFQVSEVEPANWSAAQRWMKYLNFYTLTSIEVLDSEAYALQRDMNGGKGSAWRQVREARQVRAQQPSPARSLRSMWVQRDDSWSDSRVLDQRGPRAIFVVLRDHGGDNDVALNKYLDEQYIPEILHIPGFLGAERYEAAGPVKDVGVRGAQPRYMDVYDITTAEVVASGAYRRFLASLDVPSDVKKALVPVGSGAYTQRPSPWLVSAR